MSLLNDKGELELPPFEPPAPQPEGFKCNLSGVHISRYWGEPMFIRTIIYDNGSFIGPTHVPDWQAYVVARDALTKARGTWRGVIGKQSLRSSGNGLSHFLTVGSESPIEPIRAGGISSPGVHGSDDWAIYSINGARVTDRMWRRLCPGYGGDGNSVLPEEICSPAGGGCKCCEIGARVLEIFGEPMP